MRKLLSVVILMLVICAGSELTISPKVYSEEYPTKPISLVVPFAAGGGTDVVGRMVANSMEKFLPTQVVIINKAGGGGTVGMQEVASAKADGYTLLFTSAAMIGQTYQSKGKVDFNRFYLLAILNREPHGLVVAKNAPWKTLEEFIRDAKNRPGKIRIGSTGPGTTTHLMIPEMERAAGVKFQLIPYQGSHPFLMATLGGHVDACVPTAADANALLESGDLRLLAISFDKRLPKFPEVPTFREKGMDVEVVLWRGVWVRREIPEPVLDKLEEALRKVASSESFKDTMTKAEHTPGDLVGRVKLQKEVVEQEAALVKKILKEAKLID